MQFEFRFWVISYVEDSSQVDVVQGGYGRGCAKISISPRCSSEHPLGDRTLGWLQGSLRLRGEPF